MMSLVPWFGFVGLILGLIAIDLFVLHRRPHAVSVREALSWTAAWVGAALVFNALLYPMYEQHWFGVGRSIGHELSGRQAVLQFFTGYLIEESLSLDNVMVIALILSYFRVPAALQHRVLFWGVLGALALRGIMIAVGSALIDRFAWVIYVFGAILLFTAVRLLVVRHDNFEPERNPIIKLARRFFPVTTKYDGDRFFTRVGRKRAMTPLFMSLVLVESSDVLFAVDSIPAIFAVTRDPFLVFTSNAFAILGLRTLYFALAAVLDRFRYLKMSLVFVLAFVGVKMLVSHSYPIPTGI
ncbi:MAG: TerC family protein, partial [Candidatus Eisenbacteria bacterium]|nr:TerC family protein [Candidatus Eisenbacteria bacterium]